MAFWDIEGVTTGETFDDETEILTASDFRASHIVEGNGFQFLGEPEYQITRIEERSGRFFITPAYVGGAKSNEKAWVKVYFTGAAAAQQQLIAAQDFFIRAMEPNADDLTPGRVKRVGDFGWDDQTIILNSEVDLNEITVPGEYGWSGSSVPSSAPNASGSHTMQVFGGVGRAYRQVVWRTSSIAGSSLKYERNLFIALGDGTGVGSGNNAFSSSPWLSGFDAGNALNDVSMSNGIPTGGMVEVNQGEIKTTSTLYETIGDMWFRTEKHMSGAMTVEIELVVDCADTSRSYSWPENFVAGGKVFMTGFSYADTSPNAALLASNDIHIVAFNGSFSIGMGTAGTMPATPTADERLRLAFRGRWTD